MRTLAVCLLLLAPVLSNAAGGQSTAAADAKAAASAGVANAQRKSEMQMSNKVVTGRVGITRADAKAEAKAGKVDKVDAASMDQAKRKIKGEAKAKAEPPAERKAAAPTSVDQSVCDLSPHPSWCDQ